MSFSKKDRTKAEKKYGHLLEDGEFPCWFDGFSTILTNRRLLSTFSIEWAKKSLTAPEQLQLEISIHEISELKKAKLGTQLGFDALLSDGNKQFFNSPLIGRRGIAELEELLVAAKVGDFGFDIAAVADGLRSRQERSAELTKSLRQQFDEFKLEQEEAKQQIKDGLGEISEGFAEMKEEREAKKAERVALEEEAGEVVASEAFGTNWVTIYREGYVKVSKGLGVIKGLPEKIVDIWGETDVTKKTGLGRAVGAVVTSGVNLLLASNQRGNIYLTITTEKQVHSLVRENPKTNDINSMHKLVAAGKSVLKQQSSDEQRAEAEDSRRDLPAQLKELSKLAEDGVISKEEFEAAKAKLLG